MMIMSDEQFEALYDYLNSEPTCDHTLKYTLDWLIEHHVQDRKANLEKIIDLGGHCDCEVLMNVTPDIWEERRYEQITGPIILGESEWKQYLSKLLTDSGMEE